MGLLVGRSEDDEERGEISIAGLDGLDGGRPPETVYDLDDWSERDRGALRDRLETLGVPHRWDGLTLVVVETDEAWVERIMDQVEDDLSVAVDTDGDQIAYDLAGWDADARVRLLDLLDQEVVAFAVEADELFIDAVDEQRVDELIDALLSPEGASVLTESASAEVMGELFVAADRLAHDPIDPEGTLALIGVVRSTVGSNPPYGMDKVWWDGVLGHADRIIALLDVPSSDGGAVIDEATLLRDALRPYV